MRTLIRWVLTFALVVGVWMALVLTEWLPRPTAEEQAALAALAVEPDSAKGERDGFAATWLMGFEVPEDRLVELLNADIAAYDKKLAETGSVVDFRSTAEGQFATVASPTGKDPALCELWNDDCLERVRAAPEATRQRLADFSKRLERSRWLGRYDHFHYPFTPRFDSPIAGSLGGLSNLQLSEAVLHYVDGQVDQAFATLCRDTAAWRRFRSRSDILIHDMVGVAQMSSAAQLYAKMLAEQPAGFAVPCPELFAPLADAELDQCATMRFEFLSTRNSLAAGIEFKLVEGPLATVFDRFANHQHMVRGLALAIAPYCQAEQRQRDAARDPTPPAVDTRCSWAQWAVDPAGCVLTDATPSYHSYHVRVLDLDARLRLLGAAIWLRKQPTANGDRPGLLGNQDFATRPTEMDSPRHEFTWDTQRSVLRMRNLEKGRGEFWEVPVATLPAAANQPQ